MPKIRSGLALTLAIGGLLVAMVVTPSLPALAAAVPGDEARAVSPGFVAGPVTDDLGASVAVSGTTVMVGAPGVNNAAGAVYVYVRNRTNWILASILIDPSNRPQDAFGGAIAMSGNAALIGSAGKAYVYAGSGARWHLQATIARPRRADGSFGYSVALSGSAALVGENALVGLGSVYVYQRNRMGWHLQQKLTDPQNIKGDGFGTHLALSGSTAVITAPEATAAAEATAAFIYVRSGSVWNHQATVRSPEKFTAYGSSVALDGSTLMIGDPIAGPHQNGTVRVYTRTGAQWPLVTSLTARGDPAGYHFGSAISLSAASAVVTAQPIVKAPQQAYEFTRTGSAWRRKNLVAGPKHAHGAQFGDCVAQTSAILVIGAPGGQSSSAYIYTRHAARWTSAGILTDPRSASGNAAGAAVGISGNTLAYGAWGVDRLSGAVYVYVRSHGQWRRQASLTDPGREPGALFGSALAISGSTLVVGAIAATPVSDANGAVYVYVRSAGRWHLRATLSKPGPLLAFGSSVAISGSTIIAGADDLGSPFVPGGGESIVFTRSGTHWRRQAVLPDPRGIAGDAFGDAVALSGGTAVIGASGSSQGAGVVYVYTRRSGERWRVVRTLADPGHKPNDGFGTALALSGTSGLVVGAPGAGNYAGAAYFYGRSGSRWRLQAVRTVSRKADVAGGFGGAVAATGTGHSAIAVIGGASVSGLALTANRCGSAFEFLRPTGHWRERERIADPQCTSYDEYGYAVAVSGLTALIGAPGAGGNAGAAFIQTVLAP